MTADELLVPTLAVVQAQDVPAEPQDHSADELLAKAKAAVAHALQTAYDRFDYASGIELVRAAIPLCEAAKWPLGLAKAYNGLGVCEVVAGNHQNAVAAYRTGTDALGPLLDEPAIRIGTAIKNNLAIAYAELLDFESAICSWEESIALAKRIDDVELILRSNVNVIRAYLAEGETKLAIQRAQMVTEWLDRTEYRESRAVLYEMVATLLFATDDIEGALSEIELEFVELKQFPDKRRELNAWVRKSDFLAEANRWQEGLTAAKHAIDLARETANPSLEARAVLSGALCLAQSEDFEQAKKWYLFAIQFFRARRAFRNEACSLTSLGELLLVEGDASALPTLVLALETAELAGAKDQIADSHNSLAKAYKKLGNCEQALFHYEQYHEIEMERRSEQSEKQLSVLKWKQSAEHERSVAEEAQKELATATLTLLSQIELLSDLRSDLLQIVRRIPPTEPAAKELRERLRNLPCKSVDWPKFEAQFLTVHPEFKQKLVQKYPELSPAEIRICILLRLDLKSHEIARLTCLSERSVEDHRYQIRKKLGVKKGEFVLDYVSKL